MTDHAVTAVRGLTHQPNVPDGTGLRISTDPSRGALTLTVAAAPQMGDEVIDTAGARLFLDSEAATMLDDKSLDVTTDSQGGLEFRVGEQQP
ncbi:adhesin [Rugosimonospora acidiphila]|uniref:adhesin n=1 Tax=Rugosimonospora acidiphila TaxID=556531 RepID=UPI0031EA2C08